MSSRRFPGIELEDWRSRLMDAHPRLFADARPILVERAWILAGSGRPDVPDGWRRVVELACERLTAALRDDGGELAILGVDEKYGELRLDVACHGLSAAALAAVELAVDLAEFRSGHVCSECGEPGRRWSVGRWLTTWCDRHGRGEPLPRKPDDDVQVTTRWANGRSWRTARRYVPETDQFEPASLPHEG